MDPSKHATVDQRGLKRSYTTTVVPTAFSIPIHNQEYGSYNHITFPRPCAKDGNVILYYTE
jgi:hypothetical protein